MDNEIVVKAQVGDVVIAKNKREFMDEMGIEIGQEWTVVDKFEYFVKIQNNEGSFWIGDLNFINFFERD